MRFRLGGRNEFLSHSLWGGWEGLNNHASPLFFAIITEVEGSLPFREGWGVGLKSHAALLMGRAYLNVRATGRSGYIPRPGKGEGVGEG